MKFHKDGTLPENGEIFVFGSNQAGRHGAGAAKVAYEKFDAVYGSGWGWQGENRKSFAFPTKDRGLNTLSLDAIKEAANQMLGITKRYPELEFFFTSLGCGLAGYNPSDIAPMFRDFGDNCSFPDTWKRFLILDLEEAYEMALNLDTYLAKAYVKLYQMKSI